jgi:hypothetical protein
LLSTDREEGKEKEDQRSLHLSEASGFG